MTPAVYTLTELRQVLGLDRAGWYRVRDRLYAEGFPRPLPALKRWDRAAVHRWIETGRAEAAADPAATTNIEDLQTWRDRLAARIEEDTHA